MNLELWDAMGIPWLESKYGDTVSRAILDSRVAYCFFPIKNLGSMMRTIERLVIHT